MNLKDRDLQEMEDVLVEYYQRCYEALMAFAIIRNPMISPDEHEDQVLKNLIYNCIFNNAGNDKFEFEDYIPVVYKQWIQSCPSLKFSLHAV